MNNNYPISTVILYSLVIALFYGFITTYDPNATFAWMKFIKTAGIAWLIATVLGYILFLLTYPKNINISNNEELAGEPEIKFFYNNYSCGFCRVEKITIFPNGSFSSEYNFLNKEGQYISEKWYTAVSDFCEDGVALIYDGEMYNFINGEGKIVSNTWFYGIEPFVDGIGKVRWNDGTVNFIGTDGKLLWSDWRPEIVLEAKKENTDDNNEDDQ